MSIKIKEKNNKNKEIKIKEKEIDEREKQVFRRILVKFRQYWRVLLLLMVGYIVGYMIWASINNKISIYLKDKKWNGNVRWIVVFAALLQGSLFCMDGFVTSLLKSPFSQMNQNINASNIITDEEKDYLTFRNTNSNENCKETLKKFGILTIAAELIKVFIRNEGRGSQTYQFEDWIVISYLVPLIFVLWDIWRVHKMLKKVKGRLEKKGISFSRPHEKKFS